LRTYGTIRRDGTWLIEAEPHVVIRLKRVFSQLKSSFRDGHRLSDTIDVARDLAWFRERYPLDMSDEDDAYLRARAAEHREREALVANLLRGAVRARSFELAVPPRDYQRQAAEMALRTRGLLIGDDLGLGKTCAAICALTEPATRPALVVCPTHLVRQWQAEIQKFAPSLSVHVLRKKTPYDVRLPSRTRRGQEALPFGIPDILISTYTKLSGWTETLRPVVKSVVFDEVQDLRVGSSQKCSAAYALAEAADYRIGLSATPIYNYGAEIFNIYRALSPGTLGSWNEFLTEWCGAVDHRGRSSLREPKAFGSYLLDTGLMVRRRRSEVGREMPDVSRVMHEVEVDSVPLRDITSAALALARTIVTAGSGFDKMRAAEELGSMVRHATGVAKAPYVAEFVKLLVDSGESVVLFGWHHDVYSIWKERLAAFKPAVYTGRESPSAKARERERFISGETPLMIMSLRSGSGLDGLQERSSTVVFGELDWSPNVHDQCIGRVDRDGQSNKVVAYYLVSTEGSDPTIIDVLGVKRWQSEGIRNPTVDLDQQLETTGERIRALAEDYLARHASDPAAASVFSLAEARLSRE